MYAKVDCETRGVQVAAITQLLAALVCMRRAQHVDGLNLPELDQSLA